MKCPTGISGACPTVCASINQRVCSVKREKKTLNRRRHIRESARIRRIWDEGLEGSSQWRQQDSSLSLLDSLFSVNQYPISKESRSRIVDRYGDNTSALS